MMGDERSTDELTEEAGSLRFAIRALERRAWLTNTQEAELREMRRELRMIRKEIDRRVVQKRLF